MTENDGHNNFSTLRVFYWLLYSLSMTCLQTRPNPPPYKAGQLDYKPVRFTIGSQHIWQKQKGTEDGPCGTPDSTVTVGETVTY